MSTATSTKPRVELISAEGEALSTRTQQMRFLVTELGVTRKQAHHLIAAYQRDLVAPLPISATKTYRLSFLAWLMEERPLGLSPGRKAAKHGRDYRPRNNSGHLIGGK